MPKIRIFLVVVGGMLAALGIIVALSGAVSGMFLAPQPTLSPFDQTDDVIQPDQALVPHIAPTIDPDVANLKILTQVAAQAASALDPATLVPAPTEVVAAALDPDRLVIPSIQLDAQIVPAEIRTVAYLGKNYPQWKVPNFFAAGWAPSSAALGTSGNTVLFGHHNEYGLVFAHLVDLKAGDLIVVYSGGRKFSYAVALKMILPERNQPVDVRLENARWILPSTDERLTLLTCWPALSNTHRLIIVAIPIDPALTKNYPITPRFTPLAP